MAPLPCPLRKEAVGSSLILAHEGGQGNILEDFLISEAWMRRDETPTPLRSAGPSLWEATAAHTPGDFGRFAPFLDDMSLRREVSSRSLASLPSWGGGRKRAAQG